ncbi:MAG: MBOAT family protein [Desulfuromonadaceae bacterium]|nr:MBOAT family protein [Desulfuromonadaceae bacterium]
MTFTSLSFFIFLPIVYLVFHFTVDHWRWLVLLVASYGFYATFKAPYLLAVLFLVTLVSYTCGLRIGSQQDEAGRKRWLQIGIITCIVILALLKYLPILETQANTLLGLNSSLTKTVISIGVSYFSFQAISYLADVYLEIEEPEKHLGYYSLYMAFFPKLLQGPIERAGDLLPQLKKSYQFDYHSFCSGLILITWGLFKKVVVADRFAICADQVFNNIHTYNGLSLFIGTYAYAFQIFFDFSAYTDMARGVGRIFGINLTENFNSPYLATSIADFWRRWHISFSRWILDYIFKPLQLSWRSWGPAGTALALIITFFVSGVWHGASWGFVVWGILHGMYLATSTFYKPYQKRLHKILGIEKTKILKLWQVVLTFNLVSFTWIFFRSEGIKESLYFIRNMFSFSSAEDVSVTDIIQKQILLGVGKLEIIILVLAFVITIIVSSYRNIDLLAKPIWVRWPAIYALLLSIFFLGSYKTSSFIYFKF